LDGAKLAKDALSSEGYDVLGCYMSHVGDVYNIKVFPLSLTLFQIMQLSSVKN
jgi:hypothetical protein